MNLQMTVVVLVGLLCVLDLVLTLGVIKRLREHTTLLAQRSGGGPAPTVAVGEPVGPFTASTVDGEPIDRDLLAPDTVVAFFSPTCEPCKRKLPLFKRFAEAQPGGRDRLLAVVSGDRELAQVFVDELAPVLPVVVEDSQGEIGKAFRIQAFPSVLRVGPDESGTLVVTENEVDLEPVPVA